VWNAMNEALRNNSTRLEQSVSLMLQAQVEEQVSPLLWEDRPRGLPQNSLLMSFQETITANLINAPTRTLVQIKRARVLSSSRWQPFIQVTPSLREPRSLSAAPGRLCLPQQQSCYAEHRRGRSPLRSHLGSQSLRIVDVHGRPFQVRGLLKQTRRSGLNCRSQTSKAREGSRPPWVQIPPLPPIYQQKRRVRLTPTHRAFSSGSQLPRSRRGGRGCAPKAHARRLPAQGVGRA
jgi:hypothetical protein